MRGAAVGNHLMLDAVLFQLICQGSEIIHGDGAVSGTVQNQELSLCFAVILPFRSTQPAVESNETFNISTGTGIFKDCRATKTIAHDNRITCVATFFLASSTAP